MKTSSRRCGALSALAFAPAAHAAGWKQVTAAGGSNIDQVDSVRTADGVLHVAWKKDGDVFHTVIGARREGRRDDADRQSGWASTSDPAIVTRAGRAARDLGRHPHDRVHRDQPGPQHRVRADGGASWALQTGSVVPIGAQSYASDTSATTLPNGTTLQARAGTLGTWVHAGLDPATPNFNYQARRRLRQ